MKSLCSIALLGATIWSAPAACADRDWINYQDLLRITSTEKFYAAPAAQRDKLRILGTIKPNNPAIAAADIAFTVIHGEQRKRIAVAADGTFDPSIDSSWVRANPKVLTNMPAGEKARFAFAVAPLVPGGVQFDYAGLMASVRQCNDLIKTQAGMMRFMLPTFVGIQMRYPRGQAATAHIRTAGGEKTVTPDADGLLRLPLDEALLRAGAQLTLSQRPQSFDFITD